LLDDYKFALSLRRDDVGFVHSGWEQYRKYYDDTGGYFPDAKPPAPHSGSDLHLDMGKAWIDLGLTLPNWPRMVLGYEYDDRHGQEATTEWGAAPGAGLPNIAPASQHIEEGMHVIKFDLDYDTREVTVEERFRGQFYNLHTDYTNVTARSSASENAHEVNTYFQGANTLRVERKFSDWLYGSAGYLCSQLNSDDSFTDSVNHNIALLVQVPQITLEKESHVFNLNALLGPLEGLTFSGGVESEWTRQHGAGGYDDFLNPIYTNGSAPATATSKVVLSMLSSDYDENSVTESAALRYAKIPFTALFADARCQQQSIGQSDDDLQPVNDFLQNTAFSSQWTDLRLGFDTSPWRSVSFSANCRRYENNSQYQNPQNAPPPVGYPGFIRERDLLTDEVEARLALRPSAWFKTTLTWQGLTTDYSTVTDAARGGISPGGGILSGQYSSQVYAVNTTVAPRPGFWLSATFTYQPTSSLSAANGVPTVAPYRGDIYTFLANGTYAIGQKAELFANYSYSEADYAQNNFAAGLPVGLQYQQHAVGAGLARRFGRNVTAKLQYNYYYYAEPAGGGAANYAATSIFATLTFKGP